MQTVIFEVDLVSKFYNHWPYFKIYHNNKLIFNDEIIESKTLVYKLDCEKHNNLVFNHYGKQFGENNVWDKNPDTGEECLVTIKDIRLNSVSIGDLKRKLIFDVDWSDNFSFSLERSKEVVGNICLLSGCRDAEFSTDAYVENKNQGAFTFCLLKILNNNLISLDDSKRFNNGTLKLRNLLKELNVRLYMNGFTDQHSQLSLSKMEDVERTLDL